MSRRLPAQSGALARRSIVRTVRQPASVVFPLIFPMLLLLVNSGGLDASTQLPGFPTDSFLAFALAVPFIQGALFSTMNAGTDLAQDIQTGFLNRLSLTSMRGVALIAGQLGGVVVMGLVQAAFYIVVGPARRRRLRRRAARDPGALRLRRHHLDRLRRARRLPRAPHGLGRGDPGPLPAALRLPLPLLDEHAARPDQGGLVPLRRDGQSRLVPDRVRPQPDHHRLERRGARARLRHRRADRDRRHDPGDALAQGEAGCGHEDLAGSEWGRVADAEERLHQSVALLSLADLSALLLHRVRGRALAGRGRARLRLPARLHGVPVLLRADPVGGVRRRLHRLRDRARLRVRLRAATAARRPEPERDRARLRDRGARALDPDRGRSSRSSPCSPG